MIHDNLQGNWAVVVAYREAPKLQDGRLAYGEMKKLMSQFQKSKQKVKRIIALIKSADRQGIALDLSDRRSLNQGQSKLTEEITAAMKAINKDNLKKKI